MVQLYQVPELTYAGSPEDQELARTIFLLMRAQGFSLASRSPIRQSLTNLAQYLAEQKYKGLEDPDQISPLVDQSLSANSAIFLREELDDGEVVYKTTRFGVAPPSGPVVFDHHSFKSRLFEGAKAVQQLTEEEKAALAAEQAAHASQAPAIPLPFAASEARLQAQAAAAAAAAQVPAATPPATTPARDVKPEVKPAATIPATPAVEVKPETAPAAATTAPVAQPVPTEAVEQPKEVKAPVTQPVVPVETPAVVAPVVAPSQPITLELAEGVSADLSQPVADIVNEYGDYFAAALEKSLSDDFRFVNFISDWYLEEVTGRYTKGDFRRIRDYMNEVQGPVSDEDILTNVYNKRKNADDYENTRFALNFRLLREKKDFEYVGSARNNWWTAPGLPSIGQGKRKASEIGLDYKFLEDAHLADTSEVAEVKGRKTWEHTITFYEYENGVLPYDSSAKEMFPAPVMEDQKSLVIRLYAPQLYYTYTAELRYSTGARGGWVAGLENFFADNLIPGAKLLISQADNGTYEIEYEVDNEQERRLLFYDERRQKFVYRTIAFACRVDENQILTPERFSKLDNQKRLEENERRKTDLLIANAFELVGTKAGDLLKATLDDLYPLVNIERPFSRSYLLNLLTQGNSAFRPDATVENTFTYKIGAVKK